jgi:uncharacterized membrane protein YdjX (TVP38/TMEM64 family)
VNAISDIFRQLLDQVASANPLVILAGIAVLPLLGIPVSPLMVIAGARLGYINGFIVTLLGLVLNFSAAYWVSTSLLRAHVVNRLRRSGWSVPQVSRENALALTVLIRATPGIPLFLQNYVLGIAGVPFQTFLAVSAAVHSVYGLAFVILGNGLHGSKVWQMLVGCGLLASIACGLAIARRRLAHKRKLLDSDGQSGIQSNQ